MWRRQPQEWPRIDLYQTGGTSQIKVLSADGLDRLMTKATANGWSADGRPQWFAQHRDQFQSAALVVFGSEGAELYRCIVTVVLSGEPGGRFTLDISVSDFEMLDDLDHGDLVIMAHRYLGTFPPIELDTDQAATWDGSVWREWGRS